MIMSLKHVINTTWQCALQASDYSIINKYATEAVHAMIEELLKMRFCKVKAGYFEENEASRRVMEKCGMKQLSYTDEIEYRGIVHKCFYYEAGY